VELNLTIIFDLIIPIGLLLVMIAGLPYLALNVYLAIKLRNRKYEIVNAIINSAPNRFRDRARLLIVTNASWIFATSVGYIWYSYFMLRFAWRIPKNDIENWNASIKSVFGSDYPVYRLSTILSNIWLTGLPVLILLAFQD